MHLPRASSCAIANRAWPQKHHPHRPGGEAVVRYAGVVVDTYRHFGRLGLGAVFGKKNLKALVISGTEHVDIPDIKRYKEVYNRLYKTAVQTDVMEKYHDIGTSVNINVLSWLRGLPTKNFLLSSFPEAEKISGEMFAEKHLIRRLSCAGCPIGCVHIAALKTAFSTHHEFEVRKVSYDYEPIYSLGSNLASARLRHTAAHRCLREAGAGCYVCRSGPLLGHRGPA